jgi:hypothetical protein
MPRFLPCWLPRQASRNWLTFTSCALALGCAVFACSSELEGDDGNEPPPFSGSGAPSSSAPNAVPSSTTPTPSNTVPGQVGANGDQPLPMGSVNNNTNNGNGYGSGSGGSGTGGSAATGAAGGSMVPNDPDPSGSGGTGNVTPPPQPTATQEPTQPTPTQQPTQQPPVQPPPLGGGLFLSDDFEGGMDPAWTVSNNGGGSIVIDTTRGANGSASSLRVTGGGFHIMLQYALPALVRTNNEFYGRVYLRVDSGINGSADSGHFIWLEAGSTTNDQNEMRIGYNINLLQVNHFGGPPGGDQDIRDRNRQIAPGSFHCLQFFMDNNPEQLQVWLDGTETALSTTNFTAQRPGAEGNGTPLNDWIPPLDTFRMGWELNGGGRVIWYDDVALGTQMVPCL